MDVILYSKIQKTNNDLQDLFTIDKSDNLFNNKADLIANKAIKASDGSIIDSDHTIIQYIPFEGVGQYTCLFPQNYYGTSYRRLYLFDSSKNPLRYVSGTSESDELVPVPVTFTITNSDITDVEYIGYCLKDSTIDEAMFVKSASYPQTYIPYFNNGLKIASSKLQLVRNTEKSKNLFNKHGDIKEKTAINTSTGAETTVNNQSVQYIPFEGAGYYSVLYPQNYYGQNSIKLCLYDDSKTYLRTVIGTKTVSENTPNPCNFSISASDAVNVAYIGYCFKTDTIDVAMVVKSQTYPETYIPYYESKTVLSEKVTVQEQSIPYANLNPLYGKTVVFDGDSICYGSGNGGWAKIIGENNGMEWHNVGVSGGTIATGTTSGGSNRHWVSTYIDTIYSNYQNLDYLIFEGGTNDADLLTDEQIGTLDPANYSTYDNETFVGALEYLFNKALGYYPNAKIGFIIAHKMGTWENYGYDAGDSPSNRRRRKFFEIAIQVCEKWGIPYIDLWEGSPLCPKLPCYYDSSKDSQGNIDAGKAYMDGQHLTQVGYNIITPKIEAWMKTL